MSGVYQLTFFLGLTLIAIVIAIFVLAVSLLGRAIDVARRDEIKKLLERKADNAKEMASIKKEIDEAEKKDEIPKGLKQKLEVLEKKERKFQTELQKIRKAPQALTIRYGVFYPCSFLVAALVLSGAASYLSNLKDFNQIVSLALWILGLAAIGYSISRICKSLSVIQDVAITSEEAWIKKTVEAFKTAGKELEAERLATLELSFENAVFPLQKPAGSEVDLKAVLRIAKGLYVSDYDIHIGLPKGFEFEGIPVAYERNSFVDGKDYIFIRFFSSAGLQFPFIQEYAFKIKTTSAAGTYKMWYTIAATGASPLRQILDIIVK